MAFRYVIANWKMQLSNAESVAQARQLIEGLEAQPLPSDLRVVVCPSFTALEDCGKEFFGSEVALGAQDAAIAQVGAYTGEVSPASLKELGCKYVILGHSERRAQFAETDDVVAKKVQAVIADGLTPIVCVGETREDHDAGQAIKVVSKQVSAIFGSVPQLGAPLLIAYEPRWAISTSADRPQNLSARDVINQAEPVMNAVRTQLSEQWGAEACATHLITLYGGSVDATTVGLAMKPPLLSGALIGAASQNSQSLQAIINNVRNV